MRWIFIIILLIYIHNISLDNNNLKRSNSNYRLLLSISQPDSIEIDCVRCGHRNIRYAIDTTKNNPLY